jgi:mono/diheme cytochrome c family protein
MSRGKKIALWVVAILVIGFVLIQLVPYGRDHSDPRVVNEPAWDSARTKQLATQACFDCHSNQTEWPWYSSIAPASWLVYRDVQEGRSRLNFSEWPANMSAQAGAFIGNEAAELVTSGEMPPLQYRLAHSDARLSDAEKQELAAGLKRTLGQ